jgi:hypothetical protein
MTKRYALLALLVTGMAAVAVPRAQQMTEDEQRSLRTRIEDRYDVVPLSDGIALRPKKRTGDVRLIEISDTIAINGTQVSGRELRERVGSDADAILRISYLDLNARRALFAPDADPSEPRPERDPGVEAERSPTPERPARRSRRVSRDTVRVFGDINVAEDESVSGLVVAVFGSIRIDGEVAQEAVAVLGSVNLGPKAVVRGDVVSVGGRIRRAPGAEIHGNVAEVSLGDYPGSAALGMNGWGFPFFFDGFGAVPRLLGSMFRYVLLALLASMAFVLARRTVEGSAQRVRENPVQATLVGIAAGILIIPVLFLTSFLLVLTVIGIPLLLLMPFVVLAIGLIALAGFSGTAYAVGQAARRRFGSLATGPVIDVCAGVLVILLPVLVARFVGLAGWPMDPLSWLLLAAGVGAEFLAWSSGFGAVLTNAFTRWQVTRAARATPPPAVIQ